MSLPFSLLPFLITLVNSVWSSEIGGPPLRFNGWFSPIPIYLTWMLFLFCRAFRLPIEFISRIGRVRLI